MSDSVDFAQKLRDETVVVQIKHSKFGLRKALDKDQLEAAAQVFQADERSVSGNKKLLDTTHEAYKAVNSIRIDATRYWKRNTIAFPEPGKRLIRKSKVDEFNAVMAQYREQLLQQAVPALQLVYPELIDKSKVMLGHLWNGQDYPQSLIDQFDLEWQFLSVEPPEYLKEAFPEIYAQQQDKAANMFVAAVQAEYNALTDKLAKIVSHLIDQLTGETESGKPKQVRQPALDAIKDFAARFRDLNIAGNPKLEEAMVAIEEIAGGADPKQIKADLGLREDMAAKLEGVKKVLGGMLVTKEREITFEDDEELAEVGAE